MSWKGSTVHDSSTHAASRRGDASRYGLGRGTRPIHINMWLGWCTRSFARPARACRRTDTLSWRATTRHNSRTVCAGRCDGSVMKVRSSTETTPCTARMRVSECGELWTILSRACSADETSALT